MNQGTFYGVSIGPGDPELLTLKAVRLLERCQVIAAPRTKDGHMLALEIARQAVKLDGKTILPLELTMSRDPARLRKSHADAAALLEKELLAGRDVAMLNLGDVSIYASFTYLHEILSGHGFRSCMIPGVPSFCAVAARLGKSLTSWDEPLHILPANNANLDSALTLPGTKVLMKSGKQLPALKEALACHPHPTEAALVIDCGLPVEQVYPNLLDAPDTAGYFATAIVK